VLPGWRPVHYAQVKPSCDWAYDEPGILLVFLLPAAAALGQWPDIPQAAVLASRFLQVDGLHALAVAKATVMEDPAIDSQDFSAAMLSRASHRPTGEILAGSAHRAWAGRLGAYR
jgi:hypothetical protein